MAAGNTYEAIATQTLGSTTTSITFSSIAGTYTDLVLVAAPLRSTSGGEELVMQFNGDTSGPYSSTILWGDGTTAGSYRATNQSSIILNYYASVSTAQNTQIFNIMNYANTTTNKTVIGRAGRSDSGVDAIVGRWPSTAAITSIVLKLKNGGSFNTGSVFSLYGIAAA
jgi:hypothetical protein